MAEGCQRRPVVVSNKYTLKDKINIALLGLGVIVSLSLMLTLLLLPSIVLYKLITP